VRILHTCYTYWPCNDGVSIAMQRISEGLAALGHEVVVATSRQVEGAADEHAGVRIVRFAIAGNSVTGYSGEIGAFQDFVRAWDGDVMLNYAAQICTTDLVFPLLDDLRCRKVLVPCGYSGLFDDAFADYFRGLPQWLEKYDMLVYLSEHYRDKQYGDEHGLTRSAVIGNGASQDEFAVLPTGFRAAYAIAERNVMLCVANFGVGKGQHHLVRAFREARVRDAALVMVGSEFNHYASLELASRPGVLGDLFKLARRIAYKYGHVAVRPRARWTEKLREIDSGIYILSDVPRAMVVSAYAEADLFLLASAVECAPLVLYEAMAAGTPFVCTDVGNAADLPGGVVLPLEGFSEAMRDLVARPAEWRRLGQRGRVSWGEHATWSAIVGKYEALYLALCRAGAA
jgi:L-malate glycosyltransferase